MSQMTMYCAACGEAVAIPTYAAFPQRCAKCGRSMWVSMPVAPRDPGNCPLCEGTGKLV
jgi:hypothetical protein